MSLSQRMTDAQEAPFLVRTYAPTDRAALDAMYADFRPKRAALGLPPTGRRLQRRWLDRVLQKGVHLIAEVEGRLVGHAMLIPMREDGSVELANFLHQSMRNRGIGTALNRSAVEVARNTGYKRVWLTVEPSNRAAVRSYEKAGFTRLPGSLFAPEMEMAVSLTN